MSIESKIQKLNSLASKKLTPKLELKYKKAFSKLLHSFNKLEAIPSSLTQEKLLDFFRRDPNHAKVLLLKINPDLKRKLLERVTLGDGTRESKQQWTQFSTLLAELNNPNGVITAQLDREKLGKSQDLKQLATVIENVQKDIVNNTNFVYRMDRIVAFKFTLNKYIEIQKEKGGLAAERADQIQRLITNSGMRTLAFDNINLTDEFSQKLKKAIRVIQQGLNKDPNLECETHLLHKHHLNPLGLFKLIRRKDTTAVEMLRSLNNELVEFTKDLESMKTLRLIDRTVGEILRELYNDENDSAQAKEVTAREDKDTLVSKIEEDQLDNSTEFNKKSA